MFVTWAIAIVSVFNLPDQVPIHWNLQGEVDGHGSKWTILIMPVVATLFVLIFSGVSLVLREQLGSVSAEIGFWAVVAIVASLFMAILIVMSLAYGEQIRDVARPMVVVSLVHIGLIGLPLRWVPRNPVIGVRMPWTLKSDQVWEKTHRFASIAFPFFAWSGALLSLLLTNPMWGFGLFMLSVLVVLFASWRFSKALPL